MQHILGNTLNQDPSYFWDKQVLEKMGKREGRWKRLPSLKVEKASGWARNESHGKCSCWNWGLLSLVALPPFSHLHFLSSSILHLSQHFFPLNNHRINESKHWTYSFGKGGCTGSHASHSWIVCCITVQRNGPPSWGKMETHQMCVKRWVSWFALINTLCSQPFTGKRGKSPHFF